MKILFLHGWTSVPGGRKPTYLRQAGHTVLNPALPDDDFGEAVRIAQTVFDEQRPDVVVGSSRGGAVAMNLSVGDTPLVLLCPAWKRWGTATVVPRGTHILHSRADEVIPFVESEELLRSSGLPTSALIEVGSDHRLADDEPLQRMLDTCQQATRSHAVEVTVHYLEMRAPFANHPPPSRDDVAVVHAKRPSVAYYRFLYNAVGRDYYWLSRRKLNDTQLSAIIQDPGTEVHVLHVHGCPAGFAELDRREQGEIELVQFGLMPEFIGQGLGTWFLRWTIDKASSYQAQRLWLHTCTLDHPAALRTYTKAGFVIYRTEDIRREL